MLYSYFKKLIKIYLTTYKNIIYLIKYLQLKTNIIKYFIFLY